MPTEDGGEPYAWGRQHDVRPIDLGANPGEAARMAGYIAKYATKSTEDAGGVRLVGNESTNARDVPGGRPSARLGTTLILETRHRRACPGNEESPPQRIPGRLAL